jgi:hypothetical protein
MRLFAGAIGTVIVLGASAALALTQLPSGDVTEPDAPAAGSAPAALPNTSLPTATVACRTPLHPAFPLQLWIGGDSLAGSLGPSLGELTGNTGVVQPIINSRVSSGLTSPEFYDWPEHAAEDVLEYQPEVTVFIIGANDAKTAPTDGDGLDPEWRAEYVIQVEEMMQLFVGDGRPVFWVGAPIMSDDRFSTRVEAVNQVFQEVAANHPEVVYIDAYKVFATEDGEYTEVQSDLEGETVQVRAGDGVHLTPDGGDRLALTIFQQLDPLCAVTDQAVPDDPKRPIEVEGSDFEPGTRRDDVTTVTTSAAPVETDPPVTDPPVTEPPTTTTLTPPSTEITVPPSVVP